MLIYPLMISAKSALNVSSVMSLYFKNNKACGLSTHRKQNKVHM